MKRRLIFRRPHQVSTPVNRQIKGGVGVADRSLSKGQQSQQSGRKILVAKNFDKRNRSSRKEGVNRWHHSVKVPSGHKYSVNYGVGFVVWDLIFGTFHLPQKDGRPEQPERLGHPSGLADESNYLKLLLVKF